MGSPTALANLDVENRLRWKASTGSHGIYIPSGALWGGADIKKMADIGTLKVCLQDVLLFMIYKIFLLAHKINWVISEDTTQVTFPNFQTSCLLP